MYIGRVDKQGSNRNFPMLLNKNNGEKVGYISRDHKLFFGKKIIQIFALKSVFLFFAPNTIFFKRDYIVKVNNNIAERITYYVFTDVTSIQFVSA